ncbi:MAG TPA: NfeD family protein [Bacteroidales bacterium]
MLTIAIALLILVGIALLVAEFFIFVGSVVAGITGFILTATGIFLAYKTYGTTVGNYTLLVSIILFVIAVFFSLRSKTWKKIALHSEIEGKVNTIEEHKIKVGDVGITVSKVAPMGKVKVNDVIVEAKSTGIYIEENSEVEVIKVYESNILVKPLK